MHVWAKTNEFSTEDWRRLKAFSQLCVVKKVWLFIALSFTFWKMKEPRKFAPWNLRGSGNSLFSRPLFPMLKSGAPLAQRKRRKKNKNWAPWPKEKKETFFIGYIFLFLKSHLSLSKTYPSFLINLTQLTTTQLKNLKIKKI